MSQFVYLGTVVDKPWGFRKSFGMLEKVWKSKLYSKKTKILFSTSASILSSYIVSRPENHKLTSYNRKIHFFINFINHVYALYCAFSDQIKSSHSLEFIKY